jgi:hypothetical protein
MTMNRIVSASLRRVSAYKDIDQGVAKSTAGLTEL